MSEHIPIHDLMRLTQERLLAIRIADMMLEERLSVEKTPGKLLLDRMEGVIRTHREQFGEPVGRDISEL